MRLSFIFKELLNYLSSVPKLNTNAVQGKLSTNSGISLSFFSLLIALFAVMPLEKLDAQPFPWCPDAGDDFTINAANYIDPGCNMDGVNYGMGSTGVTCTNVVIDVAGIAASEGYDLDNCNNPMLNFTVFQGCGSSSISNTNYYDPFDLLGGGNCASYAPNNGAISVPISSATNSITIIVCTTSNNQSIGPITITGCCSAALATCPAGATLTCQQAEMFANNPAGLFAFLGGSIVVTPANCGTVAISDNFNPSLPCGGNASVTFTATFTPTGGTTIPVDLTNCAAVQVTVTPAALPTMTAPANIMVACGGLPAPTTLPFSNGLSGGCLISGTSNPSTFTTTPGACGGTVTETWTATDVCGRPLASVSRTITVAPAAAPTFTNLPGNITVPCGGIPAPSQLAYTNGLAAPCNLSGNVISTQTAAPGVCGGTVTETWTILSADNCGRGNIVHSRTITVQQAPIAAFNSLPGNITISCATGTPASSPLGYSNGASGACLISGTANSTLTVLNDACPRRFTETWTFTDPCGRTITHSRIITVNIFWQNANIGAANGSGVYSCAQATPGNFGPLQATSAGYGSPTADIKHFVYAQLSGDGTIIAKFNNATNQGFGGIMFRESLAPGSRKASLRTQNSLNNVQREVRQTTNAPEVTQQWQRLHKWLRMDKIGNVIAAYTSPDGINWWSCPSHTTVLLGNCFYVGIFAEGVNVNSLSTATFDVVRITGFNQLPVPLMAANDPFVLMEETVEFEAFNASSTTDGLSNATRLNGQVAGETFDLTVYPNPVKSGAEVTLELNGATEGNVRISMYTAQGVLVKDFWMDVAESRRKSISLPANASGIYLIKAEANDKRFVTKRITVTK